MHRQQSGLCVIHTGRCKHTTTAAADWRWSSRRHPRDCPCKCATACSESPVLTVLCCTARHSSSGPSGCCHPPVLRRIAAVQASYAAEQLTPLDSALLPMLTCCQALDLLGECGTEQHGLALAGGGHVLTLHDAPAKQEAADAQDTKISRVSTTGTSSVRASVSTLLVPVAVDPNRPP